MAENWWQKGVQFQCQGSGLCCTSRGEYGFVYLTRKDQKNIAKYLEMSLTDFRAKYCDQTQGIWHLREEPKRPDCIFLKGKSCGIYKARPTQCRTWPFWPEVMSAKAWAKEVKAYCPGVGKGPVISAQEISKNLYEQIEAEKELIAERKP